MLEREKIIDISVCEENGDFAVLSENYVSIYTCNAILLTIINRITDIK